MEIRNILFIFFGVAARIDTSPAIREIVFIVTLLVLSHYWYLYLKKKEIPNKSN